MDNDRRDLIAQMKNRGLIYKEMYEVLAAKLGAQKAEALMAKAIYRRGRTPAGHSRNSPPTILPACARHFSPRFPAARRCCFLSVRRG